jgi:hypothetical protein
MRRALSQSELLSCFRKVDQRYVELSELSYPLEIDQLRTWEHGPRAFLLLADRDDRPPMGLVFHRDVSGPAMPAMCDWCHTTRARGEVTLLSCQVTPRRWVGVYLCRDLRCGQSTDEVEGPPQRILERIRTFAKRHLF